MGWHVPGTIRPVSAMAGHIKGAYFRPPCWGRGGGPRAPSGPRVQGEPGSRRPTGREGWGKPATGHSPPHRWGEARPGGAARPDSRPAPGGPAPFPAGPRRPRTPPPLPGAARHLGAPGRAARLRPAEPPPAPAPRRAPRALTQPQERQQQRPRRQAPHARRAGATLPRLLRPRRLSSSSSSSSSCSRVRAPPPGPRACSALLASREIPALGRTRAPRSAPPARLPPPAARLPPPAGRAPGAGRRSRPAEPSAQSRPLPESKREEPQRPPARASHPALCQQQTQTFPSPSPLQVTEAAPSHPLKGEEASEPTPLSPRAPAPRQTFLRPLKVGLGRTRLETPTPELHSGTPRVPVPLESPTRVCYALSYLPAVRPLVPGSASHQPRAGLLLKITQVGLSQR